MASTLQKLVRLAAADGHSSVESGSRADTNTNAEPAANKPNADAFDPASPEWTHRSLDAARPAHWTDGLPPGTFTRLVSTRPTFSLELCTDVGVVQSSHRQESLTLKITRGPDGHVTVAHPVAEVSAQVHEDGTFNDTVDSRGPGYSKKTHLAGRIDPNGTVFVTSFDDDRDFTAGTQMVHERSCLAAPVAVPLHEPRA